MHIQKTLDLPYKHCLDRQDITVHFIVWSKKLSDCLKCEGGFQEFWRIVLNLTSQIF